MIDSIYIHIPFCDNICSYCDFAKVYYYPELANKYLKILEKEMGTVKTNHFYKTIYIGGGTPSALNLEELECLFNMINRFELSKNYEFTVECNIENITLDKLKLFKKYGVNRLSIGVQSFNEKNLAFLDRKYTKKEIIEKIKLVKKEGFDNINIDIIYALPNQTLKELEEDIDIFIKLNINHISTYSLILESNTKLSIQKIIPIDEELDRKMYDLICRKLKENGYIHYEVSNFCMPGYESKHNKTYWKNQKYYGFGLGASGYINNIRYTNTKSITNYLKGSIRCIEEIQTVLSELENEIILNFRTIDGINKKCFIKKYGFDLKMKYKIEDLITKNIIIETDTNYYINEDYWYLLNEILLRFIEE